MTRTTLYKGIVRGVMTISIFTLVSLFFLLLQAERGRDHVVGKVSDIYENGLVVVDARGRTTTIVPFDEAGTGITAYNQPMRSGDFVQAFGIFAEPGVFLSEEIHIIKDPLPRTRK